MSIFADRAALTNQPAVLTVDEAAKLLRIGRNTCYEAIRRNEIPAIKIGRRVLVPRFALEQMLKDACPSPRVAGTLPHFY